MAAHVLLEYFFAILWKTTTWNDQILVWRTWTTTAEFLIFFTNWSLSPGFSFALVLTVINMVNDFRVARDSKVNINSILVDVVLRRRRGGNSLWLTFRQLRKGFLAFFAYLCFMLTYTCRPSVRLFYMRRLCYFYKANQRVLKFAYCFKKVPADTDRNVK